jgi:hypothetical protein
MVSRSERREYRGILEVFRRCDRTSDPEDARCRHFSAACQAPTGTRVRATGVRRAHGGAPEPARVFRRPSCLGHTARYRALWRLHSRPLLSSSAGDTNPSGSIRRQPANRRYRLRCPSPTASRNLRGPCLACAVRPRRGDGGPARRRLRLRDPWTTSSRRLPWPRRVPTGGGHPRPRAASRRPARGWPSSASGRACEGRPTRREHAAVSPVRELHRARRRLCDAHGERPGRRWVRIARRSRALAGASRLRARRNAHGLQASMKSGSPVSHA